MASQSAARQPDASGEFYRRTLELLPNDNGNPRFVTQPRDFNETVRKLADSGACILLCSIRYIDYIPPVQAISFRIYEARPEAWYEPFWSKGSLALKGKTLTGLFREADGSTLPSACVEREPLVWHTTARVVIRAMNGKDIVFSKDRLLDLRPGSPEFEAMKDGQRRQARQVGAQVCETKAQLRAIRAALGVEQAYSKEDALKPFVLPVLVPNPDMSNPQHANFMLAHATGHVETLFGRQRALPPAQETAVEPTSGDTYVRGTGEVIDGEVIDGLPDDEEPDGFGEPPAEAPAKPVCVCPCKEGGCGAEISAELADHTTRHGGAPRCRACWPAAGFEYERHKNLADLGLSRPVSPAKARELAEKKGGGR
jgi:hypothetical protein